MNYRVFDSKRGKVFATYEEAKAYCDWLIVEKNLFVAMEATTRKVTHKYHD